MSETYKIERSKNGLYYTLYRNGVAIGNYDTVSEAAMDLEDIRQEKAESNKDSQ